MKCEVLGKRESFFLALFPTSFGIVHTSFEKMRVVNVLRNDVDIIVMV